MSISQFKTNHPTIQIIDLLTIIYKKGLTTSSGGNISIRDKNGNIYITPAGIDKGNLTAKDICCITPGNKVSGVHPASSELSFHQEIYKIRNDINCIIHAHPPALVSFSLRNKIPNYRLIASANIKTERSVFAKYEIPGSIGLSFILADKFKVGFNSVIMENHGAVSGGSNPIEALARFESLEFLAQSELNSNLISKISKNNYLQPISNLITYPDYSTLERYGQKSSKGTELCKYIKRAYLRNFIFNYHTSFSSRIEDSDFLINYPAIPYWESFSEDLYLADLNQEANYDDFSLLQIHKSIYNKNPKVESIIIAQPPFMMAFAISNSTPDTGTIPESYIFLRDSISISLEEFMEDRNILSNTLRFNQMIILENMFIISTGSSIFEAFNRLEVAEFNAKSILADQTSLNLSLLSNKQLGDLDKKYFE